MVGRVPPPQIRPGDELTCKILNDIRDCAVEGSIAQLGPGLVGVPTPNGWSLSAEGSGGGSIKPGVTSSIITARVGPTPGSGDVDLYSYNSTTGELEADGDTEQVYSISSTVGGIPSGTYCMIQRDDEGNWWITVADCT